MANTIAADAVRVEDWEREIAAVAENTAASLRKFAELPDDIKGVTEAGAEFPAAVWPLRNLNDALAGFGPLQPGMQSDVEPWSRATAYGARDVYGLPVAPFADDEEFGSTSGAWAPADDGFDPEPAVSGLSPPAWPSHPFPTYEPAEEPQPAIIGAESPGEVNVGSMSGAWEASYDGLDSEPGVSGLPPPAWPSHQFPACEPAEEPQPAAIGSLDDASLGEVDAAAAQLVRALAAAEFARAHGDGEAASQSVADMDLMGPAPMIIERARAEQELGVVPAMPRVPWANPLRGLAVGFSLSLVAGAVLYSVLTGG
jgi:hypothetical protein